MNLGLNGQSALITGASKGIGWASARLLAQEGCDVAINARNGEYLQQQADALAAETGRRVLAVAGDMSTPGEADRITRETIDAFGKLDVLVTCAGSSPGGLIEELTEEHWATSLGLKFLGYVRSTKAVLPARDWVIPDNRPNCWEPVRMKSPMRRSASTIVWR